MSAAVTFDAHSQAYDAAGGKDWDHVAGVGATMLVLWAYTNATCTATFNGVAMTKLVDNANRQTVFYLYKPDAGTHKIALSVGVGFYAHAVSFFGTGPMPSGAVTSTGYGNSTSLTVVAKNERSMIMDGIFAASGGSLTPGAGQTARDDASPNAFGCSTKPAPAEAWNSNVSMTWTMGVAGNYYLAGVSVDAPDEGVAIGLTPILMH